MEKNAEFTYGDLSTFINGTLNYFKSLFYKLLLFIIKQWKIVLPLIIIGVVLGYYWDKKTKYEHEVIVYPNFDSVDYLYGTIDLINNKISEKDSLFFQDIGVNNYEILKKIEVEPLIDIFKLTSSNDQNLDVLKIMTEDISMNEIIEGEISKKSYLYHEILFVTKSKLKKGEVVEPILAFLNNSDYFHDLQNEYINNTKIRLEENENTLRQLNGILNNLAQQSNDKSSDNLIYFNDNNQINDLLTTKENLTINNGYLKRNLIQFKKIVLDVSIAINKKYKSFFSPKVILLPLFLLILYLILNVFIISFKNFISKTHD